MARYISWGFVVWVLMAGEMVVINCGSNTQRGDKISYYSMPYRGIHVTRTWPQLLEHPPHVNPVNSVHTSKPYCLYYRYNTLTSYPWYILPYVWDLLQTSYPYTTSTSLPPVSDWWHVNIDWNLILKKHTKKTNHQSNHITIDKEEKSMK